MYGYKRQVELTFEVAVEKIREELKNEGFGVITEIDVQATLKKKLDIDFDKYVILGACNPSFAYQAIKTERDIGLVMPCNVIVYQEKGKTFVVSTLPSVTMSVVKNEKLGEIAPLVEQKLKNAVNRI